MLTTEVITLRATTLYPFLSHPSTFGSVVPSFHPRVLLQQFITDRRFLHMNEKVFLCLACVWEWRQLLRMFCFLSHDEGVNSSIGGWIYTSWTDLRKEECRRQILGPAKWSGGEILLGTVEFQIKAAALWLTVSPVWCSLRVTFGLECRAFPPRQISKTPFGSCGLLGWGGGWWDVLS